MDDPVNIAVIDIIQRTNNDDLYWYFSRCEEEDYCTGYIYKTYDDLDRDDEANIKFMYVFPTTNCYLWIGDDEIYPYKRLLAKLYKAIKLNVERIDRSIQNDVANRYLNTTLTK